jgi:hypothetical protein
MNRSLLLLLAVAGVPLLVSAQSARVTADVTDPNVTVAPPQFQSAFANYRSNAESTTSPDKIWIGANREVSAQSEQGSNDGAGMEMPSSAPSESAKPKAQPTEQHKGHQMNMNMKGQ